MKGFPGCRGFFCLWESPVCGGSDSSGSPDEDQIRRWPAISPRRSPTVITGGPDPFAPESVQFFEVQKQIPGGCPGVLRGPTAT